MTKDEERKVIEIYGPNYTEKDIPTYIRKRDEAELKSEDRIIGVLEEEHRQKEMERKEKEGLDNIIYEEGI